MSNKHNDHSNGETYNDVVTPETPVIETEINETENIIVESPDVNPVETTPISDINPESIEINNGEEFIGFSQIVEEVVENQEESEEVVQNVEDQNNDSIENVQNVKVNTRALNIRKSPNKDGDIVTIVYKDEILTLLETDSIDGFYKVVTETGIEGYCMEQFVDLV